jgi:hypothetical protein
VELAQQLTARLVTTDLGLTRVAQIHGVVVVNVHEVAAALKPALIPGQTLSIRLIKQGEQAGQAVGYLDDGTMVVAEAAAHMVGQDTQVLVTSTIQTTAGRMVFARPIDGPMYEGQMTGRGEDAAAEGDSAAALSLESGGAQALGGGPEAALPEGGSAAVDEADAAGALPAPAARTGGGGAGGPFPPKPPARRPPSPRNPRR